MDQGGCSEVHKEKGVNTNKRKRKNTVNDDKNIEHAHRPPPSKRSNIQKENESRNCSGSGSEVSATAAVAYSSQLPPPHLPSATTSLHSSSNSSSSSSSSSTVVVVDEYHHQVTQQQHHTNHQRHHHHLQQQQQQQQHNHCHNVTSDIGTSGNYDSNVAICSPINDEQSLNNILSPIVDSEIITTTVTATTATSTTSTSIKKHTATCSNITISNTKHNVAVQTVDSDAELEYEAEQLQCIITPSSELRLCPLPALSWAEAEDVWSFMCRKDERASIERNPRMLSNHPGIQPRMRAILLDWLIEVCEVYKLHRETYYLAVDYLDRFLSSNVKISKTRLQLIGITCLFVAAKVEEIYPPKIGEFAYVTDGACLEEDIIQQELILLTALNWSISPVTIIGWLSVYMQLNMSNRTPKTLNSIVNNNNKNKNCKKQNQSVTNDIDSTQITANNSTTTTTTTATSSLSTEGDAFVYPQFSGLEFVQTVQLIDLCTLDLELASFPYSVVAAAAMCHTCDKKTAMRVSGLDWGVIAPCAKWMEPFYEVICQESTQIFLLEQNEQIKTSFGLNHICPNIVTDDSHIIQTHSTSLSLFDRALQRKESQLIAAAAITIQEASPAAASVHSCPVGLLTPPASNRKPFVGGDENIGVSDGGGGGCGGVGGCVGVGGVSVGEASDNLLLQPETEIK